MTDNLKTILTSEETAMLKLLKNSWKYRLLPAIFTVAFVFGNALFGIEPADTAELLFDTAFVTSSIRTVLISAGLYINGRKISAALEMRGRDFITLSRLCDRRRVLFTAMMIIPLIMLIMAVSLPVRLKEALHFSGRGANTLALLWFIWSGRAGFRQCDGIIPLAEKLGKI